VKKIVVNVVSFIIIVGVVFGGFFIYKNYKKNKEIKAEYNYVIKKLSKKSELVVADAAIVTSAKKEFTSDTTKGWPSWTEPIVKAVMSRTIELKIPIKTEFKIVLEGITKDSVIIDRNNILKFKKPLTVNVDSQIEGKIEILNSKSGIIDKTVDVVTAGQKAQEFFSEKSEDAVYSTSEHVMNDTKSIDKVIKYAEEALEDILNVSSDRKIDVKLTRNDLSFVNVDSKAE